VARTRTVPIRVNEYEMATIEAMARIEKLPVGTFIRRRILFEADQRGILPSFRQEHNHAGKGSEATPSVIVP
jgi:hypothetical protein